jgi:putative acetyltransferase
VVTTEIRRVRDASDFESLHALLSEYEDRLPPDLRHGSVPDLATVKRRYSDPNAAFLAVSGGVAAGCVAVTRLDAARARLRHLFVAPAFRSRGLARQLTGAAIAFAGESGCGVLTLDTEKARLEPAYRLYLSLGFEECAPDGPVDYACPTFMRLRLR